MPPQHNSELGRVSGAVLDACVAAILITTCVIACHRTFNPRDTDFRMFYSTAEMVRHGASHQLYDMGKQHAFQLRYAGGIGLAFMYPAATALLYVPGTYFTMEGAYLLWTIASVMLLAAACGILNRALRLSGHVAPFLLTALLFIPVWINFMNGQIIIVLLVAYSMALYFLIEEREFAAGIALAVGLLKFHLIVPFVFVLLLRRRWAVIKGFTYGGAAFLAVCLSVAGWRFPIDYVRFIPQMATIPQVGLHLKGMTNLRGLLFGLTHVEPPVLLLAFISLILLLLTTRAWRRTDLGFAITLVATVLVSYHQNPQDLTLLLIPLAVMYKHLHWLSWQSPAFLLFAPPLPPFLLGPHFWTFGFAVVILLLALLHMEITEMHQPAALVARATE